MREQVPVQSWLLPVALHALMAGVLLYRLVVSGQIYEHTFRDFNLALPTLTRVVLGVSRWLGQDPLVLVLVGATLPAVDGLILHALGGWRTRAGRLWVLLLASALGLAWALVELAYYLPMVKLLEGLSR